MMISLIIQGVADIGKNIAILQASDNSNTVKLVKDIEEEKEPESEPELTEGIVKTESEVVSEPVTDEEPTSEPVAVVTEEKECETLIVTPIKL